MTKTVFQEYFDKNFVCSGCGKKGIDNCTCKKDKGDKE